MPLQALGLSNPELEGPAALPALKSPGLLAAQPGLVMCGLVIILDTPYHSLLAIE